MVVTCEDYKTLGQSHIKMSPHEKFAREEIITDFIRLYLIKNISGPINKSFHYRIVP